MNFYCRWAPSLGALEDTHQNIWGTKEYNEGSLNSPAVFFGLYDARDYLALLRHRGPRFILWAGSDIKNLVNNFYFNDGKLKWLSRIFPISNMWLKDFIREKCMNYVENQTEAMALSLLDIPSVIVPSFLGKVESYKITYKSHKTPNVYLSASEGRQREYGWLLVEELAKITPWVNFHLYGAKWRGTRPNIFTHGRVPKEKMNEEVSKMQCGLRLNAFDGFSEITAKSVLWGQYPITTIKNPYLDHLIKIDDWFDLMHELRTKRKANVSARNFYFKEFNNYPWNTNK